MKKISLLLMFTALIVACNVSQDKSVIIDRHLSIFHDYNQFNGSVIVSENGKVIFKSGYGLEEINSGDKITSNTVFAIGEISKLFTASLTLKLIDKKLLKGNATLSSFKLPFKVIGESRITVSDLINRKSGLQEITELKGFKNMTIDYMSNNMINKGLEQCVLINNPGEKISNRTTDSIILGKIIESVMKKSFKEVMKTMIFDDFKLKDTSFLNESENKVDGYYKGAGRYVIKKTSSNEYLFPAIGICSTVNDLYKVANQVLAGKFLSKSFKRLLFNLEGEKETIWGGFYNGPFNMDIFYCSSEFGGYKAQFFYIEKSNDMIVLLSNLNCTPPYKYDVVNGIIAAMYRLPISGFFIPVSSITEYLSDNYNNKPIDTLIKNAKSLLLENKKSYVLENKELIRFCRDLIQLGKTESALKIALFAVEIKPKSSELYLNIARIFSLKGDVENSLKYCKLSLEFNSWNKGAIDLLQRLKKRGKYE